MGCPRDVPSTVTASPECILKDHNGQSYCGLACTKDAECAPESKCSKVSSLTGICTYTPTGTASFNVFEDAPALPEALSGNLKQMFTRFKQDFERAYVDDVDEARRFKAFTQNVEMAYAMNLEQGIKCTDLFDDEKCVFGVTKFMDLPQDEFAATRLGYKPKPNAQGEEVATLSWDDLPKAGNQSVDWRTKGAVTPVKDQGQCGSCWAFSTVEEVESSVFMATGKLLTLSTQQLTSCDKVDEGCNGGDTETAYKYIEKAGGLDTASDYPDTSHKSGRTGKCGWDKKKAAKVTGFTYATTPCKRGACKNQDEDKLAAALAAKGPISICVNAGGNAWQVYKRGVFSKKCSGASKALDHCVQLVGYDKTGDTPYWIVRNSWNTDWGIKGYMHMEMGKNLCGVADEATIARATVANEDLMV